MFPAERPLHWSFHTFIPFTTFILFLDSSWLYERGYDGQWLANVFVACYFFAMIRTLDDARLVRMMWLAVGISACAEVLCSMVLDIWVYKKEYVPLYVPLGHAIVIGTGFQILRLAWPQRHARAIVLLGSVIYFGLISAAFVWLHDSLSALLGVLFALVLLGVRKRVLYMFMPLPVLFIELVGTAFGCWHWPPAPFGVLATTNPPVGSIALYVMLDMGVLLITSLWAAHKSKLSWRPWKRSASAAPAD